VTVTVLGADALATLAFKSARSPAASFGP